MRRSIAFLAMAPLALGACDRKKPEDPQARVLVDLTGPSEHQVTRDLKGKPIPAMPLVDANGAPATLSSQRGAPVLVNLWATWCGPCVKELPQLDALAAAGRLKVVLVNEDMTGKAAVEPFVARRPWKALTTWYDPGGKLLARLGEGGLPVTILYDAKGLELWRVRGGMDWESEEAKALLAEVG